MSGVAKVQRGASEERTGASAPAAGGFSAVDEAHVRRMLRLPPKSQKTDEERDGK